MNRSVVFLAMGEEGHFQRLRAMISGVVRRGHVAHVFTDRRFEARVAEAGGRFVDLFAGQSLADTDGESIPVPSRFVTFAAFHAHRLAGEVARLEPGLVVADSFTVAGRVVAKLLGVPLVNVCSGHDMEPTRTLAALAVDPRVRTGAKCLRAVEILRGELGFPDATPFDYVTGASPHLNLYCEPPQFVSDATRRAYQPIAFFGSLPDGDIEIAPRTSEFYSAAAALRIYASFGTVIWRYYAPAARAALFAIAAAASARPGAELVVSLGGSAAIPGLGGPGVTVFDYVPQRRVLAECDVFISHQGLNSTHEAIAAQVPMLSYPFFHDQPAMAERLDSLGLAYPLSATLRGPLDDVAAALDGIVARRAQIAERLAEARGWEIATIAGRDAVIERMLALI